MSKDVLGTWDGKDRGIRHQYRYMGWSKDVLGTWNGKDRGIKHQQ